MTESDVIVIDTHALIWYLEDSPRLSPNARAAYDSIDRGVSVGIVPTIVLAELMHISERGRTPVGFAEVIAQLQSSQHFRIAAFDLDVLSRMEAASGLELHDRVIVATALAFSARLLTQDRDVRGAGIIECVW